jgi:hypothetical protein
MRNLGVIQQESNTLPSRLEVQRLVVTGRPLGAQRMDPCVRWALVLPLAAGFGASGWAVDCWSLQEQRDRLAGQAMAAEVALVHSQRERLCPQLEALATADGSARDPNAGSPTQLNYGAYIRCREQAEVELLQSRPVLYKNRSGFPYLTAEGARLAGQVDGLITALQATCSAPPAAPGRSPQPSPPGT